MSLASTSIDRPVLAIVMSLTIIIFGVIAFNFLGVREYPAVDPPIIDVQTNYVGANAEIIETQVTEPLEAQINSISGIRNLISTSLDGRSSISVEFGLDTDLEAAANDVRDRVSRALYSLPEDIEPPVVSKRDANSFPIVMMSVNSGQRSLLELTAYAENVLKERFQTINGVSQVQVWGAKRYAIKLLMVPSKMAAFSLTPLDVLNAVNRENVELPSGRVEGNFTELTVRTIGRLNSPQQFNDLIIKEDNNIIVRFRDIGSAEYAPENERTLLKFNGVPMVLVVLNAQPGSNALEITDEFYRRIEIFSKDIPADIDVQVPIDSTRFIHESISEVQQTIFIAFVLVVSIIFIFLRDPRTTIIPVLTIPISLIGSFFIMYISDFSINVLTLLGIVLAIGLVVDDTIVVLENIYTKIEKGMDPKKAGLQGTQEIFFAVIATTVALVAVFMPVIFLEGLTGRLFREFGIVVAGSVVISSFVALSLTPMLSTKLLKRREKKQWIYVKTEPIFIGLNNLYNKSLENFMRFRWVFIPIVLLSGIFIYFTFSNLQSELAPKEDRSSFRVFAQAQEGATFDYMESYVNDITDTVLAMIKPEELVGVASLTSPGFGTGGVNSAFLFGQLTNKSERTTTQSQVASRLLPVVMTNTKARGFVIEPESIVSGGLSGQPVEYVLLAPNLEELKKVLPEFERRAREHPVLTFPRIDLKFNKPELRIEIDREKATAMGISVRDIAQTLQLAVSGRRFGYFIMDGKQYQVIGQVGREDRNDPFDLASIYIRNGRGDLVQMDNLVRMNEQSSPPTLYRFNRFTSATVSAGTAPGYTVGDGIAAMDEIAEEVLNDRFATTLAGTSQEFMESSNSLYFAFVFALILIYMVLSAQFESFVDPLIIMFTVPLAIAGALVSLWYFDQTLNIFSQIGIIMLIGLVTKNGILIVEFANQRKSQGMSINDAIIGAAEARFRPILMTTLSTILGILPIALALGAGAESRISMGIAVLGGLVFSGALTLYVIPAIYSYFTSKKGRAARF